MSRQSINIGNQSNDGTGDSLRDAFDKSNQNFEELYSINNLGAGLYFTSSLNDTPKTLIQNAILVADTSIASTVTQKILTASTGISITHSTGSIVISNTYQGVVTELTPQLGGNLIGNTYQAKDFADPVDAQDLSTKNYVDGTTVALNGGSMTGELILSGDPQVGDAGAKAASKRYVDQTRQISALSDVSLVNVSDTDLLMFSSVVSINTTTSTPVWNTSRYAVNVTNSTTSNLSLTRLGNSVVFAFRPNATSSTVLVTNSTGTIQWITYSTASVANSIVTRDASGNFSAGTMTGIASSSTSLLVNGISYSTATTSTTVSTIVARDGSGNIRAQAVISGGADLAENYVSDAAYDAGTVLQFGGSAEVTIAKENTQAVAGVVSTNPGYLMNVDCLGDYVVAIALQGRVPCKIIGQVAKGDILVSAGNGYAKADNAPTIGSVLGKSLENFDGASGTIEIAVGRL